MSDNVSPQFKRMLLNGCYSLMAGGITVLIMTIKSFTSNSVAGKTLAYSAISVAVGTLMLVVLNDPLISNLPINFSICFD